MKLKNNENRKFTLKHIAREKKKKRLILETKDQRAQIVISGALHDFSSKIMNEYVEVVFKNAQKGKG